MHHLHPIVELNNGCMQAQVVEECDRLLVDVHKVQPDLLTWFGAFCLIKEKPECRIHPTQSRSTQMAPSPPCAHCSDRFRAVEIALCECTATSPRCCPLSECKSTIFVFKPKFYKIPNCPSMSVVLLVFLRQNYCAIPVDDRFDNAFVSDTFGVNHSTTAGACRSHLFKLLFSN